ncbi:MAG: hypothetical protein PWQ97_1740 [Tepidanaerobacteraceae bacterium]|nr:hypothetical protein [Tepidanaerobacteraceae bacterium]
MAVAIMCVFSLTNVLDSIPIKPVFSRETTSSCSNITTYIDKNEGPDNFDVAYEVEKNLKIIMSPSVQYSAPETYIKHHQNEYHAILKMGDDALNYMLSQFAEGKVEGLKAHIMT